MANSNSTLGLVFLVLILLFANVNVSIATSYHGVESIIKRSKLDSKKILHEICSNLGKKKNCNRRLLVNTIDIDIDRVAPGGPDPKHH